MPASRISLMISSRVTYSRLMLRHCSSPSRTTQTLRAVASLFSRGKRYISQSMMYPQATMVAATSKPSVSELLPPVMALPLASAVSNRISRSAGPSEPSSRRPASRSRMNNTKYTTVPRSTDSRTGFSSSKAVLQMAPSMSLSRSVQIEILMILGPLGRHVFGGDLVSVIIAEMRADIIDHFGNLLVVEHAAQARHALVAHHHHENGVAGGRQFGIVGQGRILAGSFGAFAPGHVAGNA